MSLLCIVVFSVQDVCTSSSSSLGDVNSNVSVTAVDSLTMLGASRKRSLVADTSEEKSTEAEAAEDSAFKDQTLDLGSVRKILRKPLSGN